MSQTSEFSVVTLSIATVQVPLPFTVSAFGADILNHAGLARVMNPCAQWEETWKSWTWITSFLLHTTHRDPRPWERQPTSRCAMKRRRGEYSAFGTQSSCNRRFATKFGRGSKVRRLKLQYGAEDCMTINRRLVSIPEEESQSKMPGHEAAAPSQRHSPRKSLQKVHGVRLRGWSMVWTTLV